MSAKTLVILLVFHGSVCLPPALRKGLVSLPLFLI